MATAVSFRRAALTTAGLIATAGALAIRRRGLTWGSTADERRRRLAGDELLTGFHRSTTRAITVDATPEVVWPWLVQLGQDRGGFYTYDAVENATAHLDIHSAERIVPAWQSTAVGDQILLATGVGLRVAVLEPDSALVLQGGIPMGRVRPPYDFTWAFVLFPQKNGTTRLVVRERYAALSWWAPFIVQPAELVSSLMTPEMLRGIRSRAERPAIRPHLRLVERDAAQTTGRLLPVA